MHQNDQIAYQNYIQKCFGTINSHTTSYSDEQ